MHASISRRGGRLIAAALLSAAAVPAALAGAGSLGATVRPLQDRVSFAAPSAPTYLGYQVTLTNTGGNTINNVRFSAAIQGPWQGSGGSFDSAEGATCSAGADPRTVDCTIGQLKSGQAAAPFVLFFRAPQRTEGTQPVCASACAELRATVFYAEGTGGPNSVPDNSVLEIAPVQVALGTDTTSQAKSALPKAGGTLQTGNNAVAGPADVFTTRVAVPPAATYTTAEITEQAFAGCSNFVACIESDVRVPGVFSPHLTITLRQDAANIRPGTKIGSTLVIYTPTPVAGEPAPQPLVLGLCPSPTTALSDRPCIAAMRSYRKQDGADFAGDFEWTLISRRNGSYKVF